MSEQVFGAFIVKQSKRRDPHVRMYDHDEVSHVLLVDYPISQNGINEMRVNGNVSNTVRSMKRIVHTLEQIIINRFVLRQ